MKDQDLEIVGESVVPVSKIMIQMSNGLTREQIAERLLIKMVESNNSMTPEDLVRRCFRLASTFLEFKDRYEKAGKK